MESFHPAPLLPDVERYVEARLAERGRIDPERLARLDELATALSLPRPPRGEPVSAAVYVCTHNSRRSHLAQVWAHVAAARFGPDGLRAHSAGTEATALAPGAAAALERAGLSLSRQADGDARNPVTRVDAFEPGAGAPVACFSKTLAHPSLPRRDFVAVMTCTSADAACPIVPGASARVSLPFVDPKESDGRPDSAAVYDACCARIARELLEAFRRAAELRGEG